MSDSKPSRRAQTGPKATWQVSLIAVLCAMLAVTGGKERSSAEWRALLSSADFECQRIIPVSGELVSIIEAAARS